jgi:hypothetical protein
MNNTKKDILLYVKSQLATNKLWATKALVRIFQENQTNDEQIAKVTSHDNGIGFSGCDAEFLSSLAEQYLRRGNLSDKQMNFVFRKMPKYARQVVAMSDAAKLDAMVGSAK